MIEIVGFNKKYSEQFFILNKVWIEESWRLEDSDKKDLLNPDKIIEKGGQVFFALENTTYRLNECQVNQAEIDFSIDGIATIAWSGNSTTIDPVSYTHLTLPTSDLV